MTNAELRQKYRLLKLVGEEAEERIYQALDANGHIVMVHHLQDNAPATQELLALLDSLSPTDKARIVERIEVDGAPVVVTQFIQGFKTLSAWLRARTQRPPAVPPPQTAPRAGANAPPAVGDFTGLFGAAASAAAPPAPPSQPTDPVSPPVERVSAKAPIDKPSVRWREPTEDQPQSDQSTNRPVVRWKKGAPLEDSRPAPRTPPAPPPPVSPPRKAVGEFTRLFGPSGSGPADQGTAPPTPPPPATSDPWNLDRNVAPPPAPTTPRASPGEFTRLFQPERKPGGPPPTSPERGPRDYLQALNAPAVPPGPPMSGAPPAAAPGGPPGEFTRLMSGVPTASVGAAPGNVASAVPPTGGPGRPSDFTQVVSATRAPPPPATPSPDDAPEAPPRRSPRLVVLLIALGIVCLLAVAVVLYFVLKNP